MQGRKRARFSSRADAGTMRHLKLSFPARYSSKPQTRFYQIVKILDQIRKQYKGQIPTFAWKPVSETSQELKLALGTKPARENLTTTQKGDISVIHADKKHTFGKRYTLQISGSNASLAVAGSRELYDLLIDINQDGNFLLSHKTLFRSAGGKNMTKLQLVTMPSNDDGNTDSYMYSLYKQPFKGTPADRALLKAMQRQLQQLSLTPGLYVDTNNDGHAQKITDLEFKKIFGVKLLQGLSMNDDSISDLKDIHIAYRRLQPHIDGDLAYYAGIKNGSLQDVSQKSLLDAILTQAKKKKQFLPRVVIVRINDLIGYGLIAGEHISAGAIIGEYCGEISKVSAIGSQDNTYFAAYAPDEVPGSEFFVVDARKRGNCTRFINHSGANANATWAHAFDGKKFRSVISAVKPIPRGKQILLKYKDSYWSSKRSRKSSPCLSDTPYPL